MKEVRLAAAEATVEQKQMTLKAAQATIDKAAKKGVIHKKTAARKISRLTKRLNAAGA